MTPEERAVVEAALECCNIYDEPRAQARWAFDAGKKMRDAVAAYREAQSKPEYDFVAYELDNTWHIRSVRRGVVATVFTPGDAERICRLLNQEGS